MVSSISRRIPFSVQRLVLWMWIFTTRASPRKNRRTAELECVAKLTWGERVRRPASAVRFMQAWRSAEAPSRLVSSASVSGSKSALNVKVTSACISAPKRVIKYAAQLVPYFASKWTTTRRHHALHTSRPRLSAVVIDIEVVARDLQISEASFLRLLRAHDRVACAQRLLETVREIAGGAAGGTRESTVEGEAEADDSMVAIPAAMREAVELLARE